MKILAASAVALSVLGFASAAQAQQPGKLFFEGDIVRGDQAGAPGPFCVLANQFKRLEKVVWRLRVLDQAGNIARRQGAQEPRDRTARRAEDATRVSARIRRRRRGRPTDHFWTCDLDHPGELSERHLRLQGRRRPTCNGQAHTWEPFMRTPSQLTVVAGVIEIKKPEPKK